jgi:hypothetical protein
MTFVPGLPHRPRGPLARYLPPLAEGVAAEYLARYSKPGDLVFDPFGQSVQLLLEAALTGRRIVAANPNPVAAFALRLALDPLPETALRAALTGLADLRKDGERLEVHLQGLYRTTCPDCGAEAQADYFEWDKEAGEPVAKTFFCPTEQAMLTRPVDAADVQAARPSPARSLSYHWALERAAPPGQPEREDTAEILAAYTPRALHALVLILNKLEAQPGDEAAGPARRATEALLLAAFEEAASVWPPTAEPHARPRTIHPPARFREFNPWRAMENAVGQPALPGTPARFCSLDDLLAGRADGSGANAGCACLLDESARAAGSRLPPGSVDLALTALPRPSPALWAFSAVWSAWLWGRPAAAPMRPAIQHKRSDFDWHEQGLRRAFTAARPALAPGAKLAGLLPDAEAGVVEAVLAAADASGFRLSLPESAYRSDPPELQAVWEPEAGPPPHPRGLVAGIRREAPAASRDLLRARGEPADWATLHFGVWMRLAAGRRLAQAAALDDRPLSLVGEAVAAGTGAAPMLLRLGADGAAEPTAGQWWLSDPEGAAEPLADRVERETARLLVEAGYAVEEADMDAAVCSAVAAEGLAPGRRLVRACLASYAEPDGEGAWRLRAEDEPAARQSDMETTQAILADLGERLGYDVDEPRPAALEFRDSNRIVYAFVITGAAALATLMLRPRPPSARALLVLPGGRAGLAAFKLSRDARLPLLIESGAWGVLKFRHVRRMAADRGLDRAGFHAMLDLDPAVEKAAAQLPLL